MSLKFEVADWKFEITLSGMTCTPLEQGEEKNGAKAVRTKKGSWKKLESSTLSSPLNASLTKKRRGIQNELS
jgi:hypothetical protein